MPIEARKIPQNVYIEDRIIGPLTLRQIIIIAVGGGVSYAMYATLVKALGRVDIITTIVVWTPAALCAAFALIKINDLSLMRMLLLTIERLLKAPVRTWAPRQGIAINIRVQSQGETELAKHRLSQQQESEAQGKIKELSSMIDTAFVDQSAPDESPAAAPVASTEVEAVVPVKQVEKRTLPVQKNRITVDSSGMDDAKSFSDLAVFQDILPPSHA